MLAAEKECSDETFKLSFTMVAPPEYKAEVTSLDKQGAINRLNKALGIIEKVIKEREGTFKLVQGPIRVGAK